MPGNFGAAKFRKKVSLPATGVLEIPNSTSAVAALGGNGRIALATQGGTPAIAAQINGSTFYWLRDGNV